MTTDKNQITCLVTCHCCEANGDDNNEMVIVCLVFEKKGSAFCGELSANLLRAYSY
jgi:hypothetical protein